MCFDGKGDCPNPGSHGWIDLDELFEPTGGVSKSITVFPDSDFDTISFDAKNSDPYGAVFWQYPRYNWDDLEGRNLSPIKRVEFQAASGYGTERVTFGVGYPDSTYYTAHDVALQTAGKWHTISINLSGRDLAHVAAGFGCIIKKKLNPKGATIYVKDVRLVL